MGKRVVTESFAERILRKIEHVAGLYHRLLLVAAPAGGGKTAALQEVHKRTGAPLINVNRELARRMLALSARGRILRLPDLLQEIVRGAGGEVVLLDNLEILFDPAMQHDPLQLLRGLARGRSVAAAWNGAAAEGFLTYAAPGHAERRRYSLDDLPIVGPREAA